MKISFRVAAYAAVFLALLFSQIAGVQAAPVTVVNSGFETTEPVQGFPSTFGDWGVDFSTIVGAENSITPFEGSQMLKFDSTFLNNTLDGTTGDVAQLIDVSGFSGAIATGLAQFTVSAFFNRIAGDSETDTQFNLVVRSFAGTPLQFANSSGLLPFSGSATTSLFSDSNLSTWEIATVSLTLPVSTTFVLLGVSAIENVFNDDNRSPSAVEFDGHYADGVSASITGPGISSVPIPAALPLLVSGLSGLGLVGWRRRKAA